MTYYLWELLRDAYQSLGQLNVQTATGGSTTTIVDSKLSPGSRDGDWIGAAAVIFEADGEAPEGVFVQVSDYTSSTGTLTLEELTAAVESGDTYGLASPYYPLGQMVSLANLALRDLGDIPLVEIVTLEGNQVSWSHRRPYRVDVQTGSGENGGDGWETVFWWEFVPAALDENGLLTNGQLSFGRDLGDGKNLRIWYQGQHPRLDAYDDVVSEVFAPALAAAALTEMALRWQNSRLDGENIFLLQRWNDAKLELQRIKAENPVWQPPRPAKSRLAGI